MSRVAMGPSQGGGMGGHGQAMGGMGAMGVPPPHHGPGQRPPHQIRPMPHHPPAQHHSVPPVSSYLIFLRYTSRFTSEQISSHFLIKVVTIVGCLFKITSSVEINQHSNNSIPVLNLKISLFLSLSHAE